MVEEETKEVPEEEETNPMIAEARALAESILEGNRMHQELLKKQEKLLAEQALAGNLGGRVEAKPKVEDDDEYSKRIEKEISEGLHND